MVALWDVGRQRSDDRAGVALGGGRAGWPVGTETRRSDGVFVDAHVALDHGADVLVDWLRLLLGGLGTTDRAWVTVGRSLVDFVRSGDSPLSRALDGLHDDRTLVLGGNHLLDGDILDPLLRVCASARNPDCAVHGLSDFPAARLRSGRSRRMETGKENVRLPSLGVGEQALVASCSSETGSRNETGQCDVRSAGLRVAEKTMLASGLVATCGGIGTSESHVRGTSTRVAENVVAWSTLLVYAAVRSFLLWRGNGGSHQSSLPWCSQGLEPERGRSCHLSS